MEGGCKPVCTSAALKTGDTRCARQERRSSGGLASLLGAEGMICFQARRCGQEQVSGGGRALVAEDREDESSSPQKTIYGKQDLGIEIMSGIYDSRPDR